MFQRNRICSAAFLATLPITASLTGCTEPNPDFVEPTPPCASGQRYLAEQVEFAASSKVDILVVMENTATMAETQAAFGSALSGLVTRLEATPGLDWQLGVTTSDTADNGTLYTGRAGVDGCPDTLPAVLSGATADAGATAGCLAQVGTEGSPFARPLESARLALVAPANAQSGLVRADARLVLLFVGLHDDCSAPAGVLTTDPNSCVWSADRLISTADYAATFRQTKPFAGTPVSIVSVAGPADGLTVAEGTAPAAACSGSAEAFAGNRLAAVSNAPAVSGRSLSANICASSFGDTMEQVFSVAVAPAADSLCLRFDPVDGLQSLYPLSRVAGGLQANDEPISDAGFWFDAGTDSECSTSRILLDASGHPTASAAFELRYCSSAAAAQ